MHHFWCPNNSLFVGACNLQILPRLTEDADGQMEKWNYSLLLLQKLFKQSALEMSFYNSMNQRIYKRDIIQRAITLVNGTRGIPPFVQSLYDHWRGHTKSVSFDSWANEASGHENFNLFLEFLGRFVNLKTGRHEVAAIRNTFRKLNNISDLNGKIRFLKKNTNCKVKVNEIFQRANKQELNPLSWRCSKCWFKNGIQRVNGIWHRFCDFEKCGFCGSPKSETVVTICDADSALDSVENKADAEDVNVPVADGVIDKFAKQNLCYLSCSDDNGDALCPAIREMAEMLLKHSRYCKLVEQDQDAHLEAKELDEFCTAEFYKSAVLQHIDEHLQSSTRESVLQSLKQNLDDDTDKICDFGTLFGFKGKRSKFIKFLKKDQKIKGGHATTTFKRVRSDLQKISLENWMKTVTPKMEYLQEHIKRKHLDGATEKKREALYEYFQSVIHSEDDDVAKNKCLDHRNKVLGEEDMENGGRIFDDIHSDLCHHQTVEEMWNDLINPIKTLSVDGMQQLLTEHLFPGMELGNDVKSLFVDAIDEYKIDGDRFLSLSSDFVESKVMEFCKKAHDETIRKFRESFPISKVRLLSVEEMISLATKVQKSDFKQFITKYFWEKQVDGLRFAAKGLREFEFARPYWERREKQLAEMWRSTRRVLEMYNFRESCSVPKRADVNHEDNDYGYPQVHWVFKQYFVLEGEECPDQNSLIDIAGKQVAEFKKGVPGDFRKDVASYFEARNNDENKRDMISFVNREVDTVQECSAQELITLFTFEANDSDGDEKKELEARRDDGVFARFDNHVMVHKMEHITGWKQKIVDWIQREKINGKMLSSRTIQEALLSHAMPPDKPRLIKQLQSPCRTLIRLCQESAVSAILKAAEAQSLPSCLVMQRVRFILKRFHTKTRELGLRGFYEDGMRHFVGNLPGYGPVQLQNDTEHVLDHKWKGRPCLNGRECIHSQRALRDRQNAQSQDIERKKRLFRTKSSADFVTISMLDRLHCIVHHDGGMVRSQDKRRTPITLFQAFKQDAHSANLKETYSVYDSGNFVDYAALKPLHHNLKDEMMNNRLCPIQEHQFNEHVRLSQLALASNSTNSIKHRRAWKADESNDIQMNEGPRIEHVVCIKMYCNDDSLCKEFCNSFRSIKDHQGSESEITQQDITQNHIDNFYWFGRYLSCAIELFGDTATEKTLLYRGVSVPFLFNAFSTVYEVPLSTTRAKNVAQQFATESGIVLVLSPKYKNEINSSRYLDVGLLGLSDYDNEKERLVKCFVVSLL